MRGYQQTLTRYQKNHYYRQLTYPCGIDFSSNDYLAFANSARIKNAIRNALDREIPVGASGSRLLRGQHEIFAELESVAAKFFGSERALYVNSGYCANLAVLSTLPTSSDIILYDEYVHASMRDGIKQSRAEARSFQHQHITQLRELLVHWRQTGGRGHPFIAVESLYSMDGDLAPLHDMYSLAQEFDGFLVIDDAHGTGVYGDRGQGLAAIYEGKTNVITIHTCGKALGVAGALIACNRVIYEYLINRARNFMFSTAPSPLMAVAVKEAIAMCVDAPHYRSRLQSLCRYARSATQIIPVIVKKNEVALRIASRLQAAGFDVRAIRPPTVALSSARLRIAMTLHVTELEIAAMFTLLNELLIEEKIDAICHYGY